MKAAWVIGAGGLLGSALMRRLIEDGVRLHLCLGPFQWHDYETVTSQLRLEIARFAQACETFSSWEIYWAAGKSSFSSSADDMARESRLIDAFLQALASQPQLKADRGAIAFTSSAGGLYAGSDDPLISESSAVAPVNAYGVGKQQQEDLFRQSTFAANAGRVLIARVTSLYGPGQSLTKNQGLISRIARSALIRKPIPLRVPMDTMRDYLYSDDAAMMMIRCLRDLHSGESARIKILSSERPTSIAELISGYRLIVGQRPLWLSIPNHDNTAYLKRHRYQSRCLPDVRTLAATSLPVGILRVLATERYHQATGGFSQTSHTSLNALP